ncbi:MAG: TauD/TfdA family dioxygenase, partial [Gammaproteobacteria bacterium]|nr:TauD/TfdA family dioxygenase [Gammaproteobacteria bacterium]
RSHCQEPAAEGGDNACIDPEIIYIRLRDENPDYIRALMQPACMTIPANSDATGELRAEQTGPVFSVDEDSGALHMRYTARGRNIAWAADPLLSEALAFLETLLRPDAPHAIRFRLEAGQGILCNNVLHMRTGFHDGPGQRRTFYRARFYERIAGT